MNFFLSNILTLFFGAIGLGISLYIFLKHRQKKALVCPIGGSCDFVTSTKYAKTFGVPNTVMGIVYYGLVAAVSLYHLIGSTTLPDWFCAAIAWMSVASLLFSIYLLYIQAFVIKRWCSWCVFSAICSAGIVLVILLGNGH